MDRQSGGGVRSDRFSSDRRSSYGSSDQSSRFSSSSGYSPYAAAQQNGNTDCNRRSNGFNGRQSNGFNDRRSSFGSSDQSSRFSSSGYHPYARNGNADCDRRSSNEYNNRSRYEGGNPRRSSGYVDRNFGGGYNDRGGRGGSNRGGGNFRGRSGKGPGTGRARDDDSITEAMASENSSIAPLSELGRLPMIFKADMTARVNGYVITTKAAKVVYQYDIQWTGKSKRGKFFNLNSQTKADQRLQLKQVALFTVFDQLLRENKEFFGFEENASQFVYDTGSIFFAHRKLLDNGEPRKFDINVEEFSQEAKNFYNGIESASATVSLAGEINLNSLNGDLENDRPIIQYLELAFSQHQRKDGKFYCFGNEFFEKESAEPLNNTPYVLKSGCMRSIRLIGEPADKKLLIHIIPKKTAFYGTNSITDFIQHSIRGRIDDIWHRNNLDKASEAIRNLSCTTTHMENNKCFVASGLSKDSAERHCFDMQGKDVTVAQYFDDTYKMKLRCPDLPCVVERGTNYYPLEVLEIADLKLPKSKRDDKSLASITHKCTLNPAMNVEAIAVQADKAEIRMSNDFIKNTGCRVDARRLLTVPSKQLYPPRIILKDTQKTINSGLFGMLLGDKFVQPARVRKLACVLASRYLNECDARHFVAELIKRLKLYGVEITDHHFKNWIDAGKDCELLANLAQDGFDYVLAIGESDDLHHGLKFMELNTRLITQHVMTNTIKKNDNTLYDNIAFKFNLRAGGNNWTLASDAALIKEYGGVDILKSLMANTMFFGIELTHPVGNTEPTCVGFASNLSPTFACMSNGDFGYQAPRETIINDKLLAAKFLNSLAEYHRHSGHYPSWIVVYRAGVSEGEIRKIQEKEIPVLKKVLDDMQKSNAEFREADPKLTVLMSNERTNYRLYKENIESHDKAPKQNLPPGTCVSEVIVSQTHIPSFILISQRPIQGTAHPMLYYVLEGANVVPFDHLKYLTYCLCYSNTTNSPTSMCGPLESASDLAKRARNNFKQWKLQKAKRAGKRDKSIFGTKKDGARTFEEDQYLEMLNQELKAAIIGDRFWA